MFSYGCNWHLVGGTPNFFAGTLGFRGTHFGKHCSTCSSWIILYTSDYFFSKKNSVSLVSVSTENSIKGSVSYGKLFKGSVTKKVLERQLYSHKSLIGYTFLFNRTFLKWEIEFLMIISINHFRLLFLNQSFPNLFGHGTLKKFSIARGTPYAIFSRDWDETNWIFLRKIYL